MALEVLDYPVYKPAVRMIIAMTPGTTTLVTTGMATFPGGAITLTPSDHGYDSGMIVRVEVPSYFGMQQINGLTGEITYVSATQFRINIDSSTFGVFAFPAIVMVTDPSDITLTVPLPPYRRLMLSAIDPVTGVKTFIYPTAANPISLDDYAYVVPLAENTNTLAYAVKNVLPYP